MRSELTGDQVWHHLAKHNFAVIGMVTARGEARTVGVVYIVRGHRLYIGTERYSWKARHIEQNPHVSVTVPIPKRIPFMPWIKIPSATITFSGRASVMTPGEAPVGIASLLFRGLERNETETAGACVIEVAPERDFMTYGVGVPLLQMRVPEKARRRVPVLTTGASAATPTH
jgi:Pyridoxamine 5'-phosphate oxidase